MSARPTTPALLLLSLVGLLACEPGPRAEPGPLTLQDDSGRRVALPRPARRIVSLIPATTEWLFAIGAGPLVVGRSSWGDHPAEARRVPDLGNGIDPSLEAIVATGPDLVVLYRSEANLRAARRLDELGIPVLLLQTDRLDDMVRQIALLGRATGREPAADSVLADYTRRFEAARHTGDVSVDAPSVLLLAWDQPPIVLGRGSFLSELLEAAGARNTFADIAASSAPVNVETIVVRDPDLVLVTSEGPPAVQEREEWQVVRAIREGRFLRVTGSEFARPSPRAPEAVRQLRDRLAATVPR